MRSASWIIYKVFIIFLMMTSFHAWMFWGLVNNLMFWMVAVVVSFVLFLWNRRHFNMLNQRRNIVWFILLQVTLLLSRGDLNFFGVLGIMIPTWSVFSVFLLKDESKDNLFETAYIVLAVVLTVSLIAWVLFLSGVQFPYTMEPYGDDDLYYFENYRFFLRNTTMGSGLGIPRFSSIFLEPGYLGCMISLLLYARHYKMDFWGVIMMICQFATFSLAGWLTTLIGFVAYKSFHSRRPALVVGSVAAVVLIIWGAAKTVNQGDNVVNLLVIERLTFDSDRGTIAGYDRSDEGTDYWFWNNFVKSPDVMFGSTSQADNLKINDNDWKAYIVKNGIVGLASFLLFAFYPVLSTPRRRKDERKMLLVLAVLYVLIFAQTIHMIFSAMYISLVVLGDSAARNNYQKQILKTNKEK